MSGDEVLNLDDNSATGVQGRFVYATHTDYPVKGGCMNETMDVELGKRMYKLYVV